MEFKLHTYDIQDIIIALIMLKTDDVITEEDVKRLIDGLTKINNLCTKMNNYTLTVNIKP